jgi:tetratricopeptide (TPR) repeat protein
MPEKSINEIPRPLRDQFDRGMAAYNKNNLDYAITLFTDVLQKEPAFYECREALRAAQFRRGGRAGLFKKLLGQASPALAKGQLLVRSQPAEALHCAEQVLNDDPKNGAAHELLARAALACDLPRTAVLSLDIALKNAPGDRNIAMKLAEALIAAGQIERADRIYADLVAAYPGDLEIARAYKDLGARRSMGEKGFGAATGEPGGFRAALRDQEEARRLEDESRHVRTEEASDRLLAEYEARFAREPDNLKLLRNIAEIHARKKDFARALEAYDQIVAREGRVDSSLEKAIAETRLAQFNHQISLLDPTAPDYAEERARLEAERDAFELKAAAERVERHPTDLGARFELGKLYFNADRITDAIRELQKAQANPHRRVASLGLLARCYARRGMNDLAARSLENAIREKPAFDAEKKELVYELGVVLEAMGRHDEAVEQFKLIYENDIGFRDVAARVDAYYARKAGG